MRLHASEGRRELRKTSGQRICFTLSHVIVRSFYRVIRRSCSNINRAVYAASDRAFREKRVAAPDARVFRVFVPLRSDSAYPPLLASQWTDRATSYYRKKTPLGVFLHREEDFEIEGEPPSLRDVSSTSIARLVPRFSPPSFRIRRPGSWPFRDLEEGNARCMCRSRAL